MIKLYKHSCSLFLTVQFLGVYAKRQCDSNRNIHCEGIANFARWLIFRNRSSVSYITDGTNLAFALTIFYFYDIYCMSIKKMQTQDLKTDIIVYRCHRKCIELAKL